MRLQAPAIAHSREERCRFTRPDCFGNTGATIFTAVAIGISLVHDWRNIGSIHKNRRRAPIFGTLPVVIDWPGVQATPAIRKNSCGSSTGIPSSRALDSLLPAFSPQTR